MKSVRGEGERQNATNSFAILKLVYTKLPFDKIKIAYFKIIFIILYTGAWDRWPDKFTLAKYR